MSILVAGGAGYIGSVVVEQLIEEGRDVVVLDNLSRGHRSAANPKATFVHGDCGDMDLLSQTIALHGIKSVMHFCALSLVGESVEAPASYYRNNISQSVALVEACLNAGIRNFIFSSTAAVYGEPESVPITEDSKTQPTNPYGRTKLFFEYFLRDCDAAYGLKSVCLRYFNAAGASKEYGEDHSPETHLIPLVLDAAVGKRESISIFGHDYDTPDGSCIRDYIHVLDLADAHLLALQRLEKGGASDYFNLGNGNGYSVREVIECARKITGLEIKSEETGRRPGDPARLVASADKARNVLGWKPRFPELEKIIQDAWDWRQKNPDGYAD
ncbi:UDP-glucose 4-epimerase GalE [Candidatus Sumerlaeota bacterium]|nr:UDP-glucose 4-epimerase GalE [Candidatus Sumerlaeota bacterium]